MNNILTRRKEDHATIGDGAQCASSLPLQQRRCTDLRASQAPAMLQHPASNAATRQRVFSVLFVHPSETARVVRQPQAPPHFAGELKAVGLAAAIAGPMRPPIRQAHKIVHRSEISELSGKMPTLSLVNVREGKPAPTLSIDDLNRSSTVSSLKLAPVPMK